MNKAGDEIPKIGAPATRALAVTGITRLSQLTRYTEGQMLELHGFGPKALQIVKEKLKENGLSLYKE